MRTVTTFYAGPDDEAYEAQSIREYLSNLGAEGIKGGVTVVEYRTKEVDEQWLRFQARRTWEDFFETFEDEFGGPDGDNTQRSDCEPMDDADERMQSLLTEMVKKQLRVWQCEEVKRTQLSEAEARIIMGIDS